MSQPSSFDEAIEVLQRVENSQAAKDARMPIHGTFIVAGDDTVHSSFDKTTTAAISSKLSPLAVSCSNLVRSVDPTDKVEFIRVNVEGVANCLEVMLAVEGDVQMAVVQEHQLRDLRKRSPLKDERSIAGFRHDQENFFYPTLDDEVVELQTTTETTTEETEENEAWI